MYFREIRANKFERTAEAETLKSADGRNKIRETTILWPPKRLCASSKLIPKCNTGSSMTRRRGHQSGELK